VLSKREPAAVSSDGITLLDVLAAPACAYPAAALAFVGLALAMMGFYYGKQRWDAEARIWRARAAAEETGVARQRVELNDLTPGPDGQELGRIVQVPDGRVMLVNSRLASGPVTLVDPSGAQRPDEIPDNLQLAAIVSSALARADDGTRRNRGSNQALDALAVYVMAQGMGYGYSGPGGLPGIEGRVPSQVRVLDEGEARLLEAGRQED
jgi:hypothetical protein